MHIKPIKKKFEDIVDAVAGYNTEKKRARKAKTRPKRKRKRNGV